MELHRDNGKLCVTGLSELTPNSARVLRAALLPQLSFGLQLIEIDFSRVEVVDGTGLGALVALHETALAQLGGIVIRLINLLPPVQQMIELARLHHLFEISPASLELEAHSPP